VASGVPVGLGEPIFDRLDADLAHALMSINAVKGVEIGDGFASVAQKGTEHRDEMTPEGFLSNHAGGILGGISSGQDIIAHIALKPTSSMRIPGRSIDKDGNACEVITTGRHDPCVGIRATPIAEAMMALTLVDHLLRHRAQNADVKVDTPVLGQLPPTSECEQGAVVGGIGATRQIFDLNSFSWPEGCELAHILPRLVANLIPQNSLKPFNFCKISRFILTGCDDVKDF
jgi:hypothetical protein